MKSYPKLKCLKLHKILRKYKNNSKDKMFILEFWLSYLFQFNSYNWSISPVNLFFIVNRFDLRVGVMHVILIIN